MKTNNENIAIKDEEAIEVFEKEIDDNVIQEIIKLSDDIVSNWAKPTKGGFLIGDTIVPEITGRIVDVRAYWVKWNNKVPDKIPLIPGSERPEGYEVRVDVIVLIDNMLVGVSLSRSSATYQLSPYLRHLSHSGLRVNEVFTKLQARQTANNFGEFTVVTFKIAAYPHDDGAKDEERQGLDSEKARSAKTDPKVDPWA